MDTPPRIDADGCFYGICRCFLSADGTRFSNTGQQCDGSTSGSDLDLECFDWGRDHHLSIAGLDRCRFRRYGISKLDDRRHFATDYRFVNFHSLLLACECDG